MMNIILMPIFCLLIFFLTDRMLHHKRKVITYVQVFLIWVLFELIVMTVYAECSEYEVSHYAQLGYEQNSIETLTNELSSIDLYMGVTPAQRTEFHKLADFHKVEGQRCFQEAQKICLLIPDLSDKDVAIHLYRMAIMSCLAGTKSFSGVIGALIYGLIEYSINVYEQWHKMNTLLEQSKYHFEMMEFYRKM